MFQKFFRSIRILNNKYFNLPEMLMYSTVIFTLTSIYVIMSQEQIGSQIKCGMPPSLPFQDLAKIERECLNSPLVSVKYFDYMGQLHDQPLKQRKYDYYRWIVAVMIVLVFIAIIPLAYFKKVLSKTPLNEEILYQDAVKIEDKRDQIIQYTTMFAEYITFERIKQSSSFTTHFNLSKMTTLLTPLVLFAVLLMFINAPNSTWFVDALYKMIYGTTQEIEPFPMNVYCFYSHASHLHTVDYTIRCLLEFNIFFEKFSAILLIWYIILFILNFIHSLIYLMILFLPKSRERFVVKHLFYNKVEISEEDLEKFIKVLGWDGYIMLVKLKERFGYQFVSKLLSELKPELTLF